MDHLLPWLRLQFTLGLGRIGLMSLINHFETPENALDASAKGWPKLPGLRAGLAGMVPPATWMQIKWIVSMPRNSFAAISTIMSPAIPNGKIPTRSD